MLVSVILALLPVMADVTGHAPRECPVSLRSPCSKPSRVVVEGSVDVQESVVEVRLLVR